MIPGRQEEFLKEYAKRYGEVLKPRFLKRFHAIAPCYFLDIINNVTYEGRPARAFMRMYGDKIYPCHQGFPIPGHEIKTFEEAYKLLEDNGFEVIWDHTMSDKRINDDPDNVYYSDILIHQK